MDKTFLVHLAPLVNDVGSNDCGRDGSVGECTHAASLLQFDDLCLEYSSFITGVSPPPRFTVFGYIICSTNHFNDPEQFSLIVPSLSCKKTRETQPLPLVSLGLTV